MFWFSRKKGTYPIGVDMGDDVLKLAQFGSNGKGISLIAGRSETRPNDVLPGSGGWQRWAIEAISRLTANGDFKGREAIAAMPAGEVFIDHIKVPKVKDGKAEDAVFLKIKQKLPFDGADAMIKYIPTENDNVMVIATERGKIDRYLAIFEKAELQIKSIIAWPIAMVNSYTMFFGRRKSDVETVVMLLDIEADNTNVVVCRHKNLLFARSIPIGTKQISNEKIMTRLALELNACRRQVGSMLGKIQIERLIFLSGPSVDKEVCTKIAKQLELPAQTGDCLAAVEIEDSSSLKINRRQCQSSWATAFGLSLS